MKWSDVFELIGFIALALSLQWLGGLTRPYAAFGGEDILALLLIGYAIHEFLEKRREARR